MKRGPSSIVVVGASLAGFRAVETLRTQGFDGDLALVGAERHLPYERPPLSKQVLLGKWSPDRARLRGVERLEEWDVELHLGTAAVGLDVPSRLVALSNGKELSFDGLVVATGAEPRTLPGVEITGRVRTLRTIEDALVISEVLGAPASRVVVVGAGFIGLEVAAASVMRGANVTVVELADVPLGNVVGTRTAKACANLHLSNGVDLRTGVSVKAIAPEPEGAKEPEGAERAKVILSDGDRIDADIVVVGVGVRACTSWLEGSGLRLDNGVLCDDRLFAAPGIVAAGDVARWRSTRWGANLRVEHWSNAAEQGPAAARSLLAGSEADRFTSVPFFWSDQYGTKIQMIGVRHSSDEERIVRGSYEDGRFVVVWGRDGRLTAALSLGMAHELVAYRRLLEEDASLGDALAL